MEIAVIGGGSWGTTLADMLSRGGHQVLIWAREREVVESINRDHINPLFLPDSPLANGLRACLDIAETLQGAELLISTHHRTPSVKYRVRSSRRWVGPGRRWW